MFRVIYSASRELLRQRFSIITNSRCIHVSGHPGCFCTRKRSNSLGSVHGVRVTCWKGEERCTQFSCSVTRVDKNVHHFMRQSEWSCAATHDDPATSRPSARRLSVNHRACITHSKGIGASRVRNALCIEDINRCGISIQFAYQIKLVRTERYELIVLKIPNRVHAILKTGWRRYSLSLRPHIDHRRDGTQSTIASKRHRRRWQAVHSA